MRAVKRGLSGLDRRRLLQGAAALGVAAAMERPARAETAATLLRVGDQIAGVRSVLEAADGLRDIPYRVEWSQFPAAAPLLEALNAGALDMGYTGDIPFLFVYAAGAPLKVIGATRSDPSSNAVVARAGLEAPDVKALEGRRIAVNRGGNGHYLALALLEQAGLSPDDVTLVFLPPTEARSALASGAVDAWAVWEPYVSLAIVEDGASLVADGREVFPTTTFEHARQDAIETKRAALADFHLRVARAQLWALDHVDVIAGITADLTKIPLQIARRAVAARRLHPVRVDEALVQATQREADLFARHQILMQRINVEPAFDYSFPSA